MQNVLGTVAFRGVTVVYEVDSLDDAKSARSPAQLFFFQEVRFGMLRACSRLN